MAYAKEKQTKNKKLQKAIAQLDSVELYMDEHGILDHYENWILAKNDGLNMPKKLMMEQWYHIIPKIKRLCTK